MSLSFASGTLSCFIFQHEVPGREENRGSRRSFLFRPVGASSAPIEGWGSTRRSSRTRWSPWMAGRGPVAAWPRAHVDGDGGGQWWWHSGGLPPRLSARDEQHDAAEALNYLVWAEKARSSEHCGGCELRPSAMADAAAFSLCQARARRGSGRGSVGECGEDARGFPHQQRARTRGGHAARRGGASSAWLSTRSPTDAFCRTAGERRCGQSGTPIWAISRPI